MHKRCSWIRVAPSVVGALCAGALGLGACGDDGSAPGGTAASAQNLAVDCLAPDGSPVVLASQPLKLWPPNHKFHAIGIEDCVALPTDCDGTLRAEFIWASSDEPIDDIGDGHHAPDIRVSSCQQVEVRSERQGPSDGRVYKLGVRAVDAAGNAAEGECTIQIDHDKRGVDASDSGEKYRIEFDGQSGLPLCDGEIPPPPVVVVDASVPPPPPVVVDAGVPVVPDAGVVFVGF
jgi:hypothetical protein